MDKHNNRDMFNLLMGIVKVLSFAISPEKILRYHLARLLPGGGGTQIWFGRECAADAAKPLPVFRGHFG